MLSNNVCPKTPPSKTDVSRALGAAWGRSIHRLGKGTFADKIDATPRTIDRALTGDSVPELHTALASLLADPCALEEVLSLYGFTATPKRSQPANDMALAAGLGHSLAEFIDRLRDGKRCHVDTAVLAALFLELIPQMQAIVDEDEARRAA